MTPENRQRLQPLYRAALQVPPGERQRFIAQACPSDSDLRLQLEAMFKSGSPETNPGYTSPGETSLEVPSAWDGRGEIIPRHTGALTPGQVLLGRFRIIALLGSGGMGDVYEAVDLELGRIALKTVRTDIAGSPETLARFKREVQLARRVSGPEVCRIHELFVLADPMPNQGPPPAPTQTPAQTTVFLTMEFLEGTTLADKISETGPLGWERSRSIALGICAGLKAIHQAGIIHRDLKCRNVMLADRNGTVGPVLMDFGLAHELPKANADMAADITQSGAMVGTPSYMAPEQFLGKAISPATDVYALGIILYEMLTGRQPFDAETPFEAAVLRSHQPPPPSSIRRDLPRRADAIVCKCLEYKPECRYQSAREVMEALQGGATVTAIVPKASRKILAVSGVVLCLLLGVLAVPAARERLQGMLFSSPEKHIAVLPIDFAEGDGQTEALGKGFMDSLSGELSNLHAAAGQTLWVVPASEVRKSKVTDSAGALRDLGATIVVKGTVERNNQELHLALTLIDTTKMRQIGFTEVDSSTGDLAALQREAVERLGRLMNLSIAQQRPDTTPSNRAAYEDYLIGLGYMERYDKPGNLDLAIGSLTKSITTDDRFALALAEIAEAYRLKYQLDRNLNWLQEAQSYCAKAAELNSGSPVVFVTVANVHEETGKQDLAVEEFQQALRLDPASSEALIGLANAYDHLGRMEEAESTYKRAIALKPDYWDVYDELGNFYGRHGKNRLAIDQYHHALQLTPDNAQVYVNLCGAYTDLDDPNLYPEAERASKRSIELSPSWGAYASLAYLYIAEHRYAESAAASEQALRFDDHEYIVWENLIVAYQWLHQDDKALLARQKILPLLQAAVEANPRDADAQVALAQLYARDKLIEKAESHIKTALALAPEDSGILSSAAAAYELLGDRQQAIKYLNRAFARGYTRAGFLDDPDLQGLVTDKGVHVPN